MAEAKTENTDALALETEIISLCATNPKGVTDKAIENAVPTVDVRQRVTAINRLLTMGKIEVLKGGSGLVYKLKSSNASNIKGVDRHEKLVYQIIESAGNKGIWTREIRYKCNLMLTEVNKILKNLESKKLIKAVKSVAASKKKVYMLFSLQPDRSVTGGAWYSDQDFESEFVEVLSQQCHKLLLQKLENAEKDGSLSPIAKNASSYCSSQEVLDFIQNLGISKVNLTNEDIETILDTLIYDGKVELSDVSMTESGSKKLYRAIHTLIEATDVTRTPCAVCPVRNKFCCLLIKGIKYLGLCAPYMHVTLFGVDLITDCVGLIAKISRIFNTDLM
uniref:DNA-directed RNA polymerase III subunit RPC6 n=1 Tax=Phallusia mammillata TaxID=59560 RepID=A0A6F9DQ65_9ASCI|nr:DNA-directed RNA polymerase III subunit RPC6-like [Phallusia mammillata]